MDTISEKVENEIGIAEARKVMRDAFVKDPHFKFGYIANISLFLYDRDWITKKEIRDEAAETILDLIFSEGG